MSINVSFCSINSKTDTINVDLKYRLKCRHRKYRLNYTQIEEICHGGAASRCYSFNQFTVGLCYDSSHHLTLKRFLFVATVLANYGGGWFPPENFEIMISRKQLTQNLHQPNIWLGSEAPIFPQKNQNRHLNIIPWKLDFLVLNRQIIVS